MSFVCDLPPKKSKMPTVAEIINAIEAYAPLHLQESYDNAGLQVGEPETKATAALLCLDVTERSVDEALDRGCSLIISHHPLLFGGIKRVTPDDERGRIIIKALRSGISIYSAHTNLDRASQGVSMEIAAVLGLGNVKVLEPDEREPLVGLGAIGETGPLPSLEFLRKVKDAFAVKSLRYSASFSSLIVRKVAVCGGAGASLIRRAVECGADAIVTGDVKYHDFTTWGAKILIADIGHYESELCTKKMFRHILAHSFPDFPTYLAEDEVNPINIL